jgi:hypothetical protein
VNVDSLAGRTVLLTGVTGFLGTAVLEKLLRSAPECRVLCLIRPGRAGAERRLADEVLATSAFQPLRDAWGPEFDARVGARAAAVAGDLGRERLGLTDADLTAVAGVDVVIHSAAEVSFDSPLDVALRTNLRGPVRLIETLRAAGARPAVVQVSTAYVSGVRRGLVFEARPPGAWPRPAGPRSTGAPSCAPPTRCGRGWRRSRARRCGCGASPAGPAAASAPPESPAGAPRPSGFGPAGSPISWSLTAALTLAVWAGPTSTP